jgi:hypothetical protein
MSCVSCTKDQAETAAIATQPAAKARVSLALYLLPATKPLDVRPLFARSIRALDSSPPVGGTFHQALLRLWLI